MSHRLTWALWSQKLMYVFQFPWTGSKGLPSVWETPSERVLVFCVLRSWAFLLWVQVCDLLLRWDPLFVRLILLLRTLQPLPVIHTPPGLFCQVIRQWEKNPIPQTCFIKWGPGSPLNHMVATVWSLGYTQAHLEEVILTSYHVLSKYAEVEETKFLPCETTRLG